MEWDDVDDLAHCLGCGRVWDGNAQCPCFLDNLDFVQEPSIVDHFIHQLEIGLLKPAQLFQWLWWEKELVDRFRKDFGYEEDRLANLSSKQQYYAVLNGMVETIDWIELVGKTLYPLICRHPLTIEPFPSDQYFRLQLLEKRSYNRYLAHLLTSLSFFQQLSSALACFFRIHSLNFTIPYFQDFSALIDYLDKTINREELPFATSFHGERMELIL